MKKIITILIVIVLIVIGVDLYYTSRNSAVETVNIIDQGKNPVVGTTTVKNQIKNGVGTTVIGKSVQGNDITAYQYGTGTKEVLFIGGIHGGYEWNTVLVAYELMDYLKSNPSAIPAGLKVTVIPALNPDGLSKVVGTTGRFTANDVSTDSKVVVSGRFNSNNVDLGRNFDCDWKANAKWQNIDVSGGKKAFSEPESQAVQKYVTSHNPAGIVTWYSAVGGVFASNCYNGVSTETKAMTKIYADASGYPASNSFDFYAITGDMVNWFAKQNIPAISVLLTNHTDTEWSKNRAGVEAILKHFAQ